MKTITLTLTLTLILIGVGVLVFLFSVSFKGKSHDSVVGTYPSADYPFNCLLDITATGRHGAIATSTEDCQRKREQYQTEAVAWSNETDLRQKAANKLCGTDLVFSSDLWHTDYQKLHCESTQRNYEWQNGAWVEAALSKKCTRFKDSVIGVVPISCFGYLGLVEN